MASPKPGPFDSDAMRPDVRLDRREVLRILAGSALLLSSGGVLVGCGGGSNSSGSGGTPAGGGSTAFSITQPITTSGGQVSDPTSKISVVVPPSSLMAPTNVQLQIGVHQRANVIPPNYTGNPNSVDIALDPTALAMGQSFQIQIPAPGPYDAFGTMMLATDDNGKLVPLAVTYDAGSNMLIGSMTAEQFKSLTSISTAQLVSSHAVSASPHNFIGGILHSIGVFVASVVRVVGPASGKFFVYRTGSSSFEDMTSSDTMTGKRIAVVVHGVFSSHTDMNPLGGLLSGSNADNSYDAVWCYEYNFGAHIADNGQIFAQKLSALMAAGDQSVDILAHSMGGLVSRSALEVIDGPGGIVNRLITLDTPHEGVPAAAVQLLVYAISGVTHVDIPSLIPGFNDCCAPLVIGNIQAPSFLTTLNNGDSPFIATADYYTSSGTHYSDFALLGIPVGNIVNAQLGGEPSDGFVPQYSALSSILNRKSVSWAQHQDTHTAIEPLNHNQIGMPNDSTSNSTVLQMLRNWLVTTQGVTIQ